MDAFSQFQFLQPLLTKAEFSVHDGVEGEGINRIVTNIVNKVEWIEGTNEAMLQVSVQLNKKDNEVVNDTLFDAEVTMVSRFRWGENITKEKANELIKFNGVALLLSYIRPIIASLTSASPFPTYNLPYINLNELYKKSE